MLPSIFFCFNVVEQQAEERKENMISQQVKRNDIKDSHHDHMEIFDKLTLNLHHPDSTDLKAWAFNCADEIKSELQTRTLLRRALKDALL